LRHGPEVVGAVRGANGVGIFLDLKLHDIPATVAGAASSVAGLRPSVLTVHAGGGADMVRAAVEAAPETKIAAVAVLTSTGEAEVEQGGVPGTARHAVRRLAVASGDAGA